MTPEPRDSRTEAIVRALRAARHDVATPVSAAALQVAIARRALDDGPRLDRVRKSLGMIDSELDRLGRLLAAMTDLADAAASEETAIERAPLAAVLDAATERTAATLAVRGLSATRRGAVPEGATIGDRDTVTLALADLLCASPDLGATAVAVACESADRVAIELDVPKGASSEGPDFLFRLTRLRDGNDSARRLFLARFRLERIGGSLRVDAVDGRLTFVATLPGLP